MATKKSATWDKDRKILFLWITPNRCGLMYNVCHKHNAEEYVANTGVAQSLDVGDVYKSEKLNDMRI